MINHLGTYECKLCLTLHSNEGSYLAHTQGKKHQDNLCASVSQLIIRHFHSFSFSTVAAAHSRRHRRRLHSSQHW